MDNKRGMIRVGPEAASPANASSIRSAVRRGISQHGLERRRRIEQRPGHIAVLRLERREARLQGRVVRLDIRLQGRHPGRVFVDNGGGFVKCCSFD